VKLIVSLLRGLRLLILSGAGAEHIAAAAFLADELMAAMLNQGAQQSAQSVTGAFWPAATITTPPPRPRGRIGVRFLAVATFQRPEMR
jgi:hypothetical protein